MPHPMNISFFVAAIATLLVCSNASDFSATTAASTSFAQDFTNEYSFSIYSDPSDEELNAMISATDDFLLANINNYEHPNNYIITDVTSTVSSQYKLEPSTLGLKLNVVFEYDPSAGVPIVSDTRSRYFSVLASSDAYITQVLHQLVNEDGTASVFQNVNNLVLCYGSPGPCPSSTTSMEFKLKERKHVALGDAYDNVVVQSSTTEQQNKKKKSSLADAFASVLQTTTVGTTNTCVTCLDSSGAWDGASCIENCRAAADFWSCVSPSPGYTSTEVCDFATCTSMDYTDCSSCTSEIKSDGTNCHWYPEFGFCDVNATITYDETQPPLMGLSACDGTSTDTYWCGGCIDNGNAWENGACVEACSDYSNGGVCYSKTTFPNDSRQQICDRVTNDFVKCALNGNCTSCVSTTQSDETTGCYWYNAYGYCDSALYMASTEVGDDANYMGASTCSIEPLK